jgi:hypothetical protein
VTPCLICFGRRRLVLFQRSPVDELSNAFLPPALAVRGGSGSWLRPLKLRLAELPAAAAVVAHRRREGPFTRPGCPSQQSATWAG